MSINPTHYSRWTIEPIEFIRANKLDALRANIIKYIMRYDVKDGQKDIDKAKEYLRYLEEDFQNENCNSSHPGDSFVVQPTRPSDSIGGENDAEPNDGGTSEPPLRYQYKNYQPF